MANISDLIQKAVAAAAGNVEIPANVKDQVLGGLSDSILGSLTQTAAKAGGLEEIKSLLTGNADAPRAASRHWPATFSPRTSSAKSTWAPWPRP